MKLTYFSILLLGGIGWGQDAKDVTAKFPNGTLACSKKAMFTENDMALLSAGCRIVPAPPKPEAVDVPAIKREPMYYCGRDGKAHCDGGEYMPRPEEIVTVGCVDVKNQIACKPAGYACADKTRILLTAGDGKKWCHKPQTE